MKHVLCAIFALMLFPESTSAQTTVSGYAISLDSGEPIPGAEVVLKDARGLPFDGPQPVLSASDGSFEFDEVEPGRYTLQASASFTEDGPVQVLVTDRFDVPEAGEEIHLGFWRQAMRVSEELSSVMQDAEPGTQETPRSPVRYELEGADLLFARARLLRPKIVTRDGRDILNVAYRGQ